MMLSVETITSRAGKEAIVAIPIFPVLVLFYLIEKRLVAGLAGGWNEPGNGVKVMALRIGWSGNYGGQEVGYVRMDFAAQAIYYAVNKGVTAINCSWGSSNSGGLGAAIDVAVFWQDGRYLRRQPAAFKGHLLDFDAGWFHIGEDVFQFRIDQCTDRLSLQFVQYDP